VGRIAEDDGDSISRRFGNTRNQTLVVLGNVQHSAPVALAPFVNREPRYLPHAARLMTPDISTRITTDSGQRSAVDTAKRHRISRNPSLKFRNLSTTPSGTNPTVSH
jgi:hypothetical protein